MKKLITSMVLMGLAVACGKGFKDKEPHKGTEQNNEEVGSTSVAEVYLDLLNDYRHSLGLRALVYEKGIEDVARTHSVGMAKHTRPFAHYGFSQRCRMIKNRVGKHKACAEVLAMGQKTPKEVLKAWLNSPEHREALEDPRYTHTGIAFEKDFRGVIYWTQIFIEL